MINLRTFIVFLFLFPAALAAQKKIDGNFDSRSCIFITKDTTYTFGFFSNGIALIAKDGYLGLADSSGTVLTEPAFDKIFPFEGKMTRVTRDGRYGILSRNGTLIMAPAAREMSAFENGRAIFQSENYKYGLVSDEGKMITQAEYDYIGPATDDRHAFYRGKVSGILLPEGKEIILDSEHQLHANTWNLNKRQQFIALSSRKHSCRVYEFHEGFANYFEKKDDQFFFGIIDLKGRKKTEAVFENIGPFEDGRAAAVKNGRWGLIDSRGNTLIPFEYSGVSEVRITRPVERKSRFLPEPETPVAAPRVSGHYFVTRDSLMGVADSTGRIMIPVSYSAIYCGFPGRYVVSKGGLSGVADSSGKLLLPVKYKHLTPLFDGLYATLNSGRQLFASSAGAYGVIDETGKEILPFKYQSVMAAGNGKGIAAVYQDSYSLNTGIPRFVFIGSYSYFDSSGQFEPGKYSYSIKVEGISDYYYEQSVTEHGPHFFGPDKWGNENGKTFGSDTTKYYELTQLPGGSAIVRTAAAPASENFRSFIMGMSGSSKTGVVNAAGNFIIPPEYDHITAHDHFPLFIVSKGEMKGVLNAQNEWVIPMNYNYIDAFGAGFALTKKHPYKMWDGADSYHWTSAVCGLDGSVLINFSPEHYHYVEFGDGRWGQQGSGSNHYPVDKKGRRLE